MMQEVLLSLLSNSLFGIKPDTCVTDNINWPSLYREAKKQACLGLLIDAINNLGLRPDEDTAKKLTTFAFQNIALHSRQNKKLASFVKWLTDRGYNPVLLKGQGIASLYPCAEFRAVGDIDIYIGDAHFDKCVASIIEALKSGVFDADIPKDQELYKHFIIDYQHTTIELHRVAALPLRPWNKKILNGWIEKTFTSKPTKRKLDKCGQEITLPTADFDAFYIFYHAVYHLLAETGVGIRHICDWVVLMHTFHDKIDTSSLTDMIEKMHLKKMWQAFGYIAVNHLGLPLQEMPLYNPAAKKDAEQVLKIIFEGGNFGNYYTDLPKIGKEGGYYARRVKSISRRTKYLIKVWRLSPMNVSVNYISHICSLPQRVIMRTIKQLNNKH